MKILIATLLLLVPALGHAAIIYSGLQEIPIPTTFEGIYIDLDNAATISSPFPGWDINPFFGGSGIANSANFQPARTGTGNLDAIIRLNLGDPIGSSLNYSTGFGGSGSPNSHLGAGANQFAVGVQSYMGFTFTLNDSSGPYYGWLRATLTNNVTGGFIHDWAYENSGASILAGATVPEPGRGALLLAGLAGCLFRRRRRSSRRQS